MSDNDDDIYSDSDSDSKSDSDNSIDDEFAVGGDDEDVGKIGLSLDKLGLDDDINEEDDEVNEDDDDVEDDDDDELEDDVDDDEINEDDEQEGGANENTNAGKKKKRMIAKPILIDSEDDDDDDDMEENYLQKFDREINKNYINEFHPECIIHNYDEISSLTKVVRDSDNIIIDPLHRTLPFLTKYERARILGQRSKQIEAGAKPFISVPEHIIEGNVIAELELQQKKIPFIIRRPIPGGAFEYWNLKDLEIIAF
jgi:DNA-directed RNA polymerase subunit K/omega